MIKSEERKQFEVEIFQFLEKLTAFIESSNVSEGAVGCACHRISVTLAAAGGLSKAHFHTMTDKVWDSVICRFEQEAKKKG